MIDEIFRGLAKGANALEKHGLRRLSGKHIDRALAVLGQKMCGGKLDIQRQLAKFDELYMRTPTGKKYNYC